MSFDFMSWSLIFLAYLDPLQSDCPWASIKSNFGLSDFKPNLTYFDQSDSDISIHILPNQTLIYPFIFQPIRLWFAYLDSNRSDATCPFTFQPVSLWFIHSYSNHSDIYYTDQSQIFPVSESNLSLLALTVKAPIKMNAMCFCLLRLLNQSCFHSGPASCLLPACVNLFCVYPGARVYHHKGLSSCFRPKLV